MIDHDFVIDDNEYERRGLRAQVARLTADNEALRAQLNANAAVAVTLAEELKRATHCPHGGINCACAINGSHDWFEAFGQERDAKVALEAQLLALRQERDRLRADLDDGSRRG